MQPHDSFEIRFVETVPTETANTLRAEIEQLGVQVNVGPALQPRSGTHDLIVAVLSGSTTYLTIAVKQAITRANQVLGQSVPSAVGEYVAVRIKRVLETANA